MNTRFLKEAESLLLKILAIPGVSGRENEIMHFSCGGFVRPAPAKSLRFDRLPPEKRGQVPFAGTARDQPVGARLRTN